MTGLQAENVCAEESSAAIKARAVMLKTLRTIVNDKRCSGKFAGEGRRVGIAVPQKRHVEEIYAQVCSGIMGLVAYDWCVKRDLEIGFLG